MAHMASSAGSFTSPAVRAGVLVAALALAAGGGCSGGAQVPTADREVDPVAVAEVFESETTTADGAWLIADMSNIGQTLLANGFIWAVTSDLPDNFSPRPANAHIVRIDLASGQKHTVLGRNRRRPANHADHTGGRAAAFVADVG